MYRKQCLINNGSLKSFVCSELDINDFENRSFLTVVSLEKLFTQFYCRTTFSNFQNWTLLYKPRIVTTASISFVRWRCQGYRWELGTWAFAIFCQMKVSRVLLGVGNMGIGIFCQIKVSRIPLGVGNRGIAIFCQMKVSRVPLGVGNMGICHFCQMKVWRVPLGVGNMGICHLLSDGGV